MLAQDGGLALRTNGLPEALMDSPGSLQRFSGEFWLSPLAVIARPQGARHADRRVRRRRGGRRRSSERAPRRCHRARAQGHRGQPRHRASCASAIRSADPRVNIIVNDARGALRLTDRRYDAIVSQPSHPWTAGASHLYTREFMQLAHDHLNSGGVFVQWMNVIFMDEDLLRSLTATLLKRVPRGARLSARSEHRGVPGERRAARCRSSSSRAAVCRCAMRRCTTRASASTTSKTSWPRWCSTRKARGASPPARRLITDDDNRIATSSVFEKGRGMTGDTSGRLFAAHDPLQRADSVVYGPLKESLSFPYLARRNGVFVLLDPSLADRVGRMSQFLTGDARGEYLRAYYYRMKNQAQRSTETLRLAIDDYPADDSLRLEFLRAWYRRTGHGQGAGGNRRGCRRPQRAGRAACSPRPGMRSNRNGAKSRSPTPRSPKFPGPASGMPRHWNCASTGASG